jgi:hypothetical protein
MNPVQIVPCTKTLSVTKTLTFSEHGHKSTFESLGRVLAIAWRADNASDTPVSGPVKAGTSYLVKFVNFTSPPEWFHESELSSFSMK